MSNTLEMPARKRRHQDLAVQTGDVSDTARQISGPATSGRPFAAQDLSPLAWWRTLPSNLLRDAEHLLLIDTLDTICVMDRHGKLAAALRGDAAAAVGVAFSLLPIRKVTLRVDIAMTALLRCALATDATATLVLANILRRVELNHSLAAELSASWQRHLGREIRPGALRRPGFRDGLVVDVAIGHAEDRA
jgi:hypothetical protein